MGTDRSYFGSFPNVYFFSVCVRAGVRAAVRACMCARVRAHVDPCCNQLGYNTKNEPARPMKYHNLIEYRREITACAFAFYLASESSGGPSPSTIAPFFSPSPPLIIPSPKSPFHYSTPVFIAPLPPPTVHSSLPQSTLPLSTLSDTLFLSKRSTTHW
ncbi:hypothetical protein EVAR_78141_1 [Eumeta japonica]|uniref:Uncharacterized protein n=1 Tax=Eumeta variegata TaxID=151549 RepID=A0A4C1V030_EUMVA|nr:hypothetical protein EVAR_78141_1 [Eumeta japonica]